MSDLQNIWRRVVDNDLANDPASKSFLNTVLLEEYHQISQGVLAASGMKRLITYGCFKKCVSFVLWFWLQISGFGKPNTGNMYKIHTIVQLSCNRAFFGSMTGYCVSNKLCATRLLCWQKDPNDDIALATGYTWCHGQDIVLAIYMWCNGKDILCNRAMYV